jgi:hypothetical protein
MLSGASGARARQLWPFGRSWVGPTALTCHREREHDGRMRSFGAMVVLVLSLSSCATARIQEQLDADIQDCARVANGDDRYYLECTHWARDHAQGAYAEHQRHVDAVYAPARCGRRTARRPSSGASRTPSAIEAASETAGQIGLSCERSQIAENRADSAWGSRDDRRGESLAEAHCSSRRRSAR